MSRRTRRKSHAVIRRRNTRKRGGSIWSWIKNKASPFLRKTKLISRGAKALGFITGNPVIGTAGTVAGMLGYGKRVKVHRRRVGRGLGRGLGTTRRRC